VTGNLNINGKSIVPNRDYSAWTNPINNVEPTSTGWTKRDTKEWDSLIRGGENKGIVHTDRDHDANASDRFISYAVPDGMRTGYLVYLPWHNSRFFDVYGTLENGKDVFLTRVSAFSREGVVDGFHHGVSIVPLIGVFRFKKIRIQGVRGQIHLMGIGWTESNVESSTQGAGYYANDQIRIGSWNIFEDGDGHLVFSRAGAGMGSENQGHIRMASDGNLWISRSSGPGWVADNIKGIRDNQDNFVRKNKQYQLRSARDRDGKQWCLDSGSNNAVCDWGKVWRRFQLEETPFAAGTFGGDN
jgi:hypothetical protein